MASNYDFRVLIETVSGSEHSFGTASFVTLATNTSQVLNTSDVVDRVNTLKSITYFNGQTHETASSLYAVRTANKFSGSTGTDTNYQFLSASMKGGADSGSIIFHANSTPTAGGDYIKRYKFFGNKVCNVIGIPENYWIYADKFRLTNTGSEQNYISGDILGQSIHLRDNFAISNAGSITSDLPMKHAENTDRWIKWQNVSGSLPQNDMLIGYGNQSNKYMIRMQNNNDLIISSSGVDFTGNITGSGDATFGTITMTGKIDTSGEVEAEHLHSTDDVEVGHSIFHSGDTNTRIHFGTDIIYFDAGSTSFDKMRISGSGVVFNEDSQDYDFRIESNNYMDMFVLDGGTNRIGIKTHEPQNILQINHNNTDGFNGMMIVREDTTTLAGDYLGGIGFDSTDGNVPSHITESSAYIAAYAAENHSGNDKGGDLAFGATLINDNDDLASHEYMRITDNGNIGIGTDNPQSKLHIEHTDTTTNATSNTYSDYLLALRNNTDTTNAFAGIAFDVSTETDSDSIGAAIKAVGDNTTSTLHDANLTFHTNDAGDNALSERMRITHDGEVGIGTTNPKEKLEVNGDISSSGLVYQKAYPAFSATRTGTGSTTTDGAWTRLYFTTEDYDLGNDFNTTSAKFTVPTKGIYHLNASLHIDNTINPHTAGFRFSGSTGPSNYPYAVIYDMNEMYQADSTGDGHSFTITKDLLLEAGTEITVEYYFNDAGGSQNIDNAVTLDSQINQVSWFDGHLITPLK